MSRAAVGRRKGSLSIVFALTWGLLAGHAGAQPTQAERPAERLVIVHAKLHRGDGAVIEDATIEIRDGSIVNVQSGAPPSGYAPEEVIDAQGGPVTPGFCVVGTSLGLVEIELEESTDDAHGHSDTVNAAIRAADGYNPESTTIAVASRAGLTDAVVVPSGGLVEGTAAWVDLGGDLGDAVQREEVAVFADLGDEGQSKTGGTRPRALSRLRELLEDTQLFRSRGAAFDRRQMRVVRARRADLEQMLKVLNRQLPLVVRVDRAVDILRVLKLAEQYRIRVVLAGVSEGWRVRNEIAVAKVPVIVRAFSNLPTGFSTLGSRYDNAALLNAAGVPLILTTPGAHDARMLRQEAGNAVAWGLPWEAALSAITRNPADVFGEKSVGTVDVGKAANLVVWTADPFEVTSWATHVIVDGRRLKRKSRQERLFDRYRQPM